MKGGEKKQTPPPVPLKWTKGGESESILCLELSAKKKNKRLELNSFGGLCGAGAIRVSHQEVDEKDVGRDPPAEMVLGGWTQPDFPQGK